jgi:aryl sulfotransferase
MRAQGSLREYRTWSVDSRRWQAFLPRPDDVIIVTYPKCGTTWMQRIVSLLVFQTTEPRPIAEISAWIEQRFMQPIEETIARIEAQPHRRFLKSHLPADGLPLFGNVKYIHVGRDGRDACMSFHNHVAGFVDMALERLSKAGMDDPAVGRPYPPPLADPAEFFHRWLSEGAVAGHEDGLPNLSFFQFEQSWWNVRGQTNTLLVHYNDLKENLRNEMERVADFLGIAVTSSLWDQLVAAASFEAMRRDGDTLLGRSAAMWRNGGRTFFNKGINGRWRETVREADLVLYEAKVAALLSPGCAQWLASGRGR